MIVITVPGTVGLVILIMCLVGLVSFIIGLVSHGRDRVELVSLSLTIWTFAFIIFLAKFWNFI